MKSKQSYPDLELNLPEFPCRGALKDEWVEEGVMLFDAHENVRAVNTRFEQMAGLAPEESGKLKTLEEWIAQLAKQAVEPAQFAERWRELARNTQGGVRELLQMALPVPRVLERAARPVLDSVGRRVGRVEIYRDLTAQRVFQSKLLQTEKLAALGQMVSGVAHELSSPLTSILGYSQRLIAGTSALGQTEEVLHIHQEAERAASILRQLLSNARETIPERQLVSLNQVVTRATELQRFALAAEKICLELDLDSALPFVQGDAGRLQQVLINLLSNALHALANRAMEASFGCGREEPGIASFCWKWKTTGRVFRRRSRRASSTLFSPPSRRALERDWVSPSFSAWCGNMVGRFAYRALRGAALYSKSNFLPHRSASKRRRGRPTYGKREIVREREKVLLSGRCNSQAHKMRGRTGLQTRRIRGRWSLPERSTLPVALG